RVEVIDAEAMVLLDGVGVEVRELEARRGPRRERPSELVARPRGCSFGLLAWNAVGIGIRRRHETRASGTLAEDAPLRGVVRLSRDRLGSGLSLLPAGDGGIVRQELRVAALALVAHRLTG